MLMIIMWQGKMRGSVGDVQKMIGKEKSVIAKNKGRIR